MRIALLALAALAAAGCSKSSSEPAKIDAPFSEGFDGAELGADWFNSGGPYRIESGALAFSNAHNHPLWLKRRLPENVKIDLDVTGQSAAGDLKVVVFGDGVSHESDEAVKKDLQYTDTGYVFIFGGWNNRLSTIVKQAEHAWQYDQSVPRRTDVHVQVGHTYHWTITRRAGHLEWWIDGQPFLSYDDPSPLWGKGHDSFGITGWESAAVYDNVKIAPL